MDKKLYDFFLNIDENISEDNLKNNFNFILTDEVELNEMKSCFKRNVLFILDTRIESKNIINPQIIWKNLINDSIVEIIARYMNHIEESKDTERERESERVNTTVIMEYCR